MYTLPHTHSLTHTVTHTHTYTYTHTHTNSSHANPYFVMIIACYAAVFIWFFCSIGRTLLWFSHFAMLYHRYTLFCFRVVFSSYFFSICFNAYTSIFSCLLFHASSLDRIPINYTLFGSSTEFPMIHDHAIVLAN